MRTIPYYLRFFALPLLVVNKCAIKIYCFLLSLRYSIYGIDYNKFNMGKFHITTWKNHLFCELFCFFLEKLSAKNIISI